MSSLTDSVIRFLLRVGDAIAPAWTGKLKVNRAIGVEKMHRPHPFSLWTGMEMAKPPEGYTAPSAKPLAAHAVLQAIADPAMEVPFSASGYVSWPGLADRRYTGRHLDPATETYVNELPPIEQVFDRLYARPAGGFVPSQSTTAMFCFFAQWFTDSFLRTDPVDRRRNTSNHEIDFCQIYGLDELTTFGLRERVGGRLRLENGYLPRLTDATGAVRPEFLRQSYIRDDVSDPKNVPPGQRLRDALGRSLAQASTSERWMRMYATGLERGNSTILYTALSTLCVREHNLIAAELATRFPGWADDRLFETARVIMVRSILTIVVEDYINHLAGGYDFRLDPSFAEHQQWYRSNRISIEFNLLYRWHSLVPDTLRFDGVVHDDSDYRFNNALLEAHGPERWINAASIQPAGRVQLFNTPTFLDRAEKGTLDMARTFRLRPFVDYCARFSMPPPQSIAELVGGDGKATAILTELYGDISNVELPVGLVAQAREKGDDQAVLPPLVRRMVAVDAFTHILTNPLLAQQVHEATFKRPGVDIEDLIGKRGGIAGLAKRASVGAEIAVPRFALARP